MPGNNHGYHCPKCGSDENIKIVAQTWVRLSSDGTDGGGDMEWDDESRAACDSDDCWWYGKVKELAIQEEEDEDDLSEGYEFESLEECEAAGAHLSTTDDDGFCNLCGHDGQGHYQGAGDCDCPDEGEEGMSLYIVRNTCLGGQFRVAEGLKKASSLLRDEIEAWSNYRVINTAEGQSVVWHGAEFRATIRRDKQTGLLVKFCPEGSDHEFSIIGPFESSAALSFYMDPQTLHVVTQSGCFYEGEVGGGS